MVAVVIASMLAVGLPTAAEAGDVAVTNDQFSLGLAPEEGGSPGVPAGYIRLWDVKTAWRDINPAPGVWDWSLLDEEIDQVERAGAKVLLVLGLTPQWAAKDPSAGDPRWGAGSASAPADPSTFSAYVTAVMQRYGGRVAAVEVWNEANLRTFWVGSADEMADLTKRAYDAVKAISPGTTVLAASTTTRLVGPLKTYYVPYVAALKARGFPFDAWSIHSYPAANVGPAARYADIVKWRTYLQQGTGDGSAALGKPVWDTEVNYGVAGPGAIPDRNIDDATGAALLARTYLDSMRAGIESTFWYLWTAGFYDLIGVQLNAGTPQTITAYTTVRDWTAGATFKGCDDLLPNVVRCYFVKGDPFMVAYSSDGNPVVFDKATTLPAQTWTGQILNPAGAVTLTDGPVKFMCGAGTDARLCTAEGALGVPRLTRPPLMQNANLAVGDVAKPVGAEWDDQGSAITEYRYRWYTCMETRCSAVLGADARAPEIPVKSIYVGRSLKVEIQAVNRAGASESVEVLSFPVVAAHKVTVPASWAPKKKNGEWTFPATISGALAWADSVSEKVPVQIKIITRTTLGAVPAQLANDIGNGDVFRIDPEPGTVLTKGAQPRTIRMYVYQQALLDGCPTGRNFRKWFTTAQWTPLRVVRDVLQRNNCTWRLNLIPGEGPRLESYVTNGRVIPDPLDPDKAIIDVYATKPSDAANLSLLVGPATGSSASSGQATLTTDLAFLVFDAPVAAALGVSTIQRNTGLGIANVTYDLFGADGRPVASTQTSGSTTNIGTLFRRTGTATLVATVGPDRAGVTRQVLTEIAVRSASDPAASRLMLDGRCLASDGTVVNCAGVPQGPASQIVANVLQRPGIKGVQPTFAPSANLRILADQGNPVQALVTNAELTPGGARARSCVWIDVICHLQNLFDTGGEARVSVNRRPTRQPVPVRVMVMPDGQVVLSVSTGGCSTPVGGSFVCQGLAINPRLINLDGGTLINLDGGTLINLDGGTLINLDGGTLINLDGGTLINLDGGTLAAGPVVSSGVLNGQPATGLIVGGVRN